MGNVNQVAAHLHDLVARRVVPPLHFASRMVRPGFRPAAVHFRDGLRFRADAVGWSEERRREWILGRLREAVRRAAALPFYADRFAAAGFDPRADFSFADYAALPPLEREEVREAGRALISPDVPSAQVRKDATGGSTGTPTTIWTGPRERGWRESGIEHFMRRIGLPAGSRIGMLWGHHLDPIARSSVRERAQDWIRNMRWYDCLRLSDEVLAGYHEELQDWRPEALVCYASSLAALAEAAAGDTPAYPKRAFVTGAEKVYAAQRERIEAVYGKPVVERYGARDIGLIAFQVNAPRMDAVERLGAPLGGGRQVGGGAGVGGRDARVGERGGGLCVRGHVPTVSVSASPAAARPPRTAVTTGCHLLARVRAIASTVRTVTGSPGTFARTIVWIRSPAASFQADAGTTRTSTA